jgi:hypothetical protein
MFEIFGDCPQVKASDLMIAKDGLKKEIAKLKVSELNAEQFPA